MIENGYAKEYTYDEPYKYQTQFQNSQEIAQKEQLGLWGDCSL
jgi:endonuclease YncB( thermonuclease family)